LIGLGVPATWARKLNTAKPTIVIANIDGGITLTNQTKGTTHKILFGQDSVIGIGTKEFRLKAEATDTGFCGVVAGSGPPDPMTRPQVTRSQPSSPRGTDLPPWYHSPPTQWSDRGDPAPRLPLTGHLCYEVTEEGLTQTITVEGRTTKRHYARKATPPLPSPSE